MGRPFYIGVSATLILACATAGYLRWGSLWTGYARGNVGVFSSEFDAAYPGTNQPTAAARSQLAPGEPVAVLWLVYGKDYQVCYVRTADGSSGWLLCTSLDRR